MTGFNHFHDCLCGWCSGGGAGGDTFPTGQFSWSHADEDFCKATNCPKCRAPVFFVRHNSGSVWFDSLGQPWPKHPCFDDDPIGLNLRRFLDDSGNSSTFHSFGIIVESKTTDFGGHIVVRNSAGETISFDFPFAKRDFSLLPGRIVVILRDEQGVLSPSLVNPAQRILKRFWELIDCTAREVLEIYPNAAKADAEKKILFLEKERQCQCQMHYRLRPVKRMEY